LSAVDLTHAANASRCHTAYLIPINNIFEEPNASRCLMLGACARIPSRPSTSTTPATSLPTPWDMTGGIRCLSLPDACSARVSARAVLALRLRPRRMCLRVRVRVRVCVRVCANVGEHVRALLFSCASYRKQGRVSHQSVASGLAHNAGPRATRLKSERKRQCGFIRCKKLRSSPRRAEALAGLLRTPPHRRGYRSPRASSAPPGS